MPVSVRVRGQFRLRPKAWLEQPLRIVGQSLNKLFDLPSHSNVGQSETGSLIGSDKVEGTSVYGADEKIEFLDSCPVFHERSQTAAISRHESDGNPSSHEPDSAKISIYSYIFDLTFSENAKSGVFTMAVKPTYLFE